MNKEALKKKFFVFYKIYKALKLNILRYKIKDFRKNLKPNLYYFFYFSFPLKKKVFLLGTPLHSNIGDSAIAIAELKFLQNAFPSCCIKEISFAECEYLSKKYIKALIKKNFFFTMGGGILATNGLAKKSFGVK